MKVRINQNFQINEDGFVSRAEVWSQFIERHNGDPVRVRLSDGQVFKGYIDRSSDNVDLVLNTGEWPGPHQISCVRSVAIHISAIDTLTVNR